MRRGTRVRVVLPPGPKGPHPTRPEFAPEADTKVLLSRMVRGQGLKVPGAGDFAAVDYRGDLHSVMLARIAARDSFLRLPNAVRSRYGSWEELLKATPDEVGALLREGRSRAEEKPKAEEVPPEAAAQ